MFVSSTTNYLIIFANFLHGILLLQPQKLRKQRIWNVIAIITVSLKKMIIILSSYDKKIIIASALLHCYHCLRNDDVQFHYESRCVPFMIFFRTLWLCNLIDNKLL